MGIVKTEPSIVDKISEKPNKTKSSRLVIIGIVVVLLIIGAVGSSIYFYTKYQSAQNVLGNSTKGSAIEAASLVKKVDKLIELPKGENPTIATVSDITKLKGQAFFAHAKNGDKVLIYTKAKKAFLYDPTTNKIIEVQTINIGSTDQKIASGSASPTPAIISVVLLNGTKTAGLATTTEKTLTTASKNITVVSKGNAKTAYEKTLVVDITGKNSASASEIAKVLKGEVGKLPANEVKPTGAEILVILGGR